MKNILAIFTKILDNESLISENKLPIHILSESEIELLKIYSKNVKSNKKDEFELDNYNTAKYMLLSDGNNKYKLWEHFISLLNKNNLEKDFNEIVFGTAIKESNCLKNWLLKKIVSKKGTVKLFEQVKKTIICEGVWHSYSIEGSLKEVDYWIDFGDFEHISIENIKRDKNIYIKFKNN